MSHHHSGGYHTPEEFNEQLFGRGNGDPDTNGYPGQDEPVEMTRAQELEQAKRIIEQFAPKAE